jgi:hypothetical protein
MQKCDNKIISSYIAPWALPNEELPFHLIWNEELEYDSIVIEFPNGLKIKEFLNVSEYDIKSNQVIVTKLHTPNYFGGIITHSDIFDENHITQDIKIHFLLGKDTVYSKTLSARFFRPRITVIKSPQQITLDDKKRYIPYLDLEMKVEGFGRVDIKIEMKEGSTFRTNPEQLYNELVRRLYAMYIGSKIEELDEYSPVRFQLNRKELESRSRELLDRMLKADIPFFIDEETLAGFRKWLKEEKNENEEIDKITIELQKILIDSLLFHFDRFPEDNIGMVFGRPSVTVRDIIQHLDLRMQYRDAAHNEYTPVELKIKVIDNRENPLEPYNIPIRIKWEKKIIKEILKSQSSGGQ